MARLGKALKSSQPTPGLFLLSHPNPRSVPEYSLKKQEFLLDPAGLSLALGNRCHPSGKREV